MRRIAPPGAIVLFVLISVAWRLASRRRSIPCPSWLRRLVELDNPFARTNRTSEVVAVDIQSEMLRRMEDKARAAGLSNVRIVQAAVGTGALDAGPADRALLVTVLGEIPDREVALGEIFHALAPGGILSVTEIVFDPHFQRRVTVAQLAGEAGFRELAFFGNAFAYTLNLLKRGSVEQADPGDAASPRR